MTFGIGEINYGALYGTGANERTIVAATSTLDGPNKDVKFNLAHLPSDAVVAKAYGTAAATGITGGTGLEANKSYIIQTADTSHDDTRDTGTGDANAILIRDASTQIDGSAHAKADGTLIAGYTIKTSGTAANVGANTLKEVLTGENAFVKGEEYVIKAMGNSDGNTGTALSDAKAILDATSVTGASIVAGTTFTVNSAATDTQMAFLNALTQGMTFSRTTDVLTKDIEAIQGLVNTARVQAGSQYAAIESAVNYTTDLTAQYELGYNTVNDVNFSMETAHLAKNQILQQAATAMLAQANQGQQGLLQLIS
jgi:flagellin